MKFRAIKLIYYYSFVMSLLLANTVQANTTRVAHCKNQCMPHYVKCSNSVAKLCYRQHIQVMDQTGKTTTPKRPLPNQLNAYESCRVDYIVKCSDNLKQCEAKCE